jgi:hypothetical protein
MYEIFINNDFRLILETNFLISGSTLKIDYYKPGAGSPVSVTALAYDETKIYYDFTDTIIDTAGRWRFRANITTVAGALVYFGKTVFIYVREEWYPSP